MRREKGWVFVEDVEGRVFLEDLILLLTIVEVVKVERVERIIVGAENGE